MKLNKWQTIRIGFCFLSICAFWQMYNNIIPLVLTDTFHMDETISGVIMAMDNILALFLLPFFGSLSDRSKSRLGKRKPFILAGTLLAVILMIILPVLDNTYARVGTVAVEVAFVAVLGLLLVAMGMYRSPAVALMPDVTPKPLRSIANAIINLMGAVGAIIYLIIASVLYSEKRTAGLAHVNYLPIFIIVAVIMLLALAVLLITVDEQKLAEEARREEQAVENAGNSEETVGDVVDKVDKSVAFEDKDGRMAPAVKKSLLFLLISIAFWFLAYNSVETWFTTYASHMWQMSLGAASRCLTIGTLGAICTYIPAGLIAERIGRKKTIIGGVVLLFIAFFAMFVLTTFTTSFSPMLYGLFILVGIGWASINVNSFPMVVEMCSGEDVGKFTGYYYTFSMAAQIVTPVVAGWLIRHVGYVSLFPYASIFTAAAFVSMQFVRHGDSKVVAKRGLEAFDSDD